MTAVGERKTMAALCHTVTGCVVGLLASAAARQIWRARNGYLDGYLDGYLGKPPCGSSDGHTRVPLRSVS